MGTGAAAECFPRVARVHRTRGVGVECSAVPAQPGTTVTGAFPPQLLWSRWKLAQGLLLSHGRLVRKALQMPVGGTLVLSK